MLHAVRRNKTVDYVGTALSLVFYAMPAYLLDLVLTNVFSSAPWTIRTSCPAACASAR